MNTAGAADLVALWLLSRRTCSPPSGIMCYKRSPNNNGEGMRGACIHGSARTLDRWLCAQDTLSATNSCWDPKITRRSIYIYIYSSWCVETTSYFFMNHTCTRRWSFASKRTRFPVCQPCSWLLRRPRSCACQCTRSPVRVVRPVVINNSIMTVNSRRLIFSA